LLKAGKCFDEDYMVCLCVDSHVLGNPKKLVGLRDHWVALISPINLVAGSPRRVQLTVFSWGENMPITNVPMEDFLADYYGFVACKY
jgi:hypothetical protein